ncbi:hypothetical protein, partial [Candidatus Pelagibacter sp.]|uniref:hypothetical protein n=1 Tax=Candidatus Pelagibacter sp. TaxID=2024849 RepID=UPI003F850F9A
IILINVLFNYIYLRNSNKIIFTRYLKYNLLTAATLVFIYSFVYGMNKELLLIHVPVYFFVFMSFFLTIGLKYINSPSEDIYEIIKKHKKISEKNIILKIKKRKIIDLRINDLIQQGFITLKNRKLSLTKNGAKISKLFNSLKKNLKVECKG